MVQAPVRALDPDGVTVVTAGTVGFALGALACWWLLPALDAAGKGWYLGVAITGFALGVGVLAFGLVRKQRRRREVDAGVGSVDQDRSVEQGQVVEPARLVEQAHVDTDGVPDRE